MLKKRIFAVTVFCIATVLALLLGEVVVRLLLPQQYMYPRGKITPEYGYVLYEDTVVVHAKPRKWLYNYTHNKYGYRGKLIPISNVYRDRNIVVLGDSNSYGMGVNDGEEYPAVMNRELDQKNVINLSVWGYGLSQQMRRFYEFGIIYQPETVILQFCSNDPKDNLLYDVTYIQDGRILFRDSNYGTSSIKRFLSDSIIQKSQLYNFFRNSIFQFLRNIRDQKIKARNRRDSNNLEPISREEALYVKLLNSFAADLNSRDIKLIVISVNNQLKDYPEIDKTVLRLESRGLLDYVEVVPLFDGLDDYISPQGHIWGTKAHERIGVHLSRVVRGL